MLIPGCRAAGILEAGAEQARSAASCPNRTLASQYMLQRGSGRLATSHGASPGQRSLAEVHGAAAVSPTEGTREGCALPCALPWRTACRPHRHPYYPGTGAQHQPIGQASCMTRRTVASMHEQHLAAVYKQTHVWHHASSASLLLAAGRSNQPPSIIHGQPSV